MKTGGFPSRFEASVKSVLIPDYVVATTYDERAYSNHGCGDFSSVKMIDEGRRVPREVREDLEFPHDPHT